ncbi:MAG: hypothetical protein H6622_07690 [Halobacteriovoraceae bacterium]|nr:hypothetical protein [Halobacteriovoraceae bacterium]
MSILGKSKLKEEILFPIRIIGKIFSSVGKFLRKDINEDRLNEIKAQHLYLAAKSHLSNNKGL